MRNNTIMTSILLYGLAIGCGFATDKVENKLSISGPTKYKKVYIGNCSFNLSVTAMIPDDYAHWKQNVHQMSALYGTKERSNYSMWDQLTVSVSCSACMDNLYGMVSVLDSKDHLVPWGCGQERPPLIVTDVTSTFIDKEGAVSSEDENTNVGWQDTPFPVYTHSFVPALTSLDKYCDGEPVLLDLNEACEVLVEAGALKKNE